MVTDLVLILILAFIAWQLYLITGFLATKIRPTSFNEALSDEEGGVNEPEPRHKI